MRVQAPGRHPGRARLARDLYLNTHNPDRQIWLDRQRYSQDRVKQARSYLKSIFDEAIEQEFLVKDPTRNLKIPKNLRPKDKTVLSWEQLCQCWQA